MKAHMNTNGQILTEANKIIDSIRRAKEAIASLSAVSAGLGGGTQKGILIQAGGASIDIGMTAQSYATVTRSPYNLAATYIRKGITVEIEYYEEKVKLWTKKLNNLTFDI